MGYIQYEKNKIRIIIDNNDEVWFNAKYVVMSLGYKVLKDTIKDLINAEDKIQLKYIRHIYDISGTHPQSSENIFFV